MPRELPLPFDAPVTQTGAAPADDALTAATAIHPFRGVLLAPHAPGEMHTLIGPPGDLPTPEAAEAFLQQRRHTENAVRLELEDADASGQYTAARELVTRWRQDGRLQRDATAGFYIHEQRFVLHGVWHTRRAVVAAVDLQGEVPLLPHEGTWADNVDRRLRVLREVALDVNPLLLLYRQSQMGALLDGLTQRQPDVTAYDIGGGVNRIWRIDAPAEVRQIAALLRVEWLVIADGHHRHVAALAYLAEQGMRHDGRVLAELVEVGDPGLLVLPIHRVVHGVHAAQWRAASERLAEWFTVEPLTRDLPLDRLAQVLPSGVGEMPQFIAVRAEEQPVRWRLRSWDVLGVESEALPSEERFDAGLVRDLVLGRALGVSEEQVEIETDAEAAVAAARDDAAGQTVTLLLRAADVESVIAVATAGRRVPAKTTSFMPKPPVGLVLHDPLTACAGEGGTSTYAGDTIRG